MFQSYQPVSRDAFHDRTTELARLLEVPQRLVAGGGPSWLAILGQRKVGKTSLLLEAQRRTDRAVAFLLLDLYERTPVDLGVFRTYALRALDVLAPHERGRSYEAAAPAGELPELFAGSSAFALLDADWRAFVLRLADVELDARLVARCLDLPEVLAAATGRWLVSAWDEFQELATLGGRPGFDVVATQRSVWQRHQRVAYVISGSEPSVLRDLASSKRSPFFQHFALLELGPMSAADAVQLVLANAEGALAPEIAARLVGLVGGNPFYLQVLGEELIREGAPHDEVALKAVVQRTLFSRSGRLGLYFERWFSELVGRSAAAAAVLARLAASADGLRLSELARALGASTGDTARSLERLGDAVVKDTRWRVHDPAFRWWLAWRGPQGAVVPMTVLGDEAERAVARALADMGFDLVYQSRASRGAFDLLATRGARQLGLQVKRSGLPLGIPLAGWRRMEAEAVKLGWRWVVAAVGGDGAARFLDPAQVRLQKTARLDAEAEIVNLAAWVDAAP